MAFRFNLLIAILMTLAVAPCARAQTSGEVSGIWLTQAGDAKVHVSKCGGGICGPGDRISGSMPDPPRPGTWWKGPCSRGGGVGE